MSWLYPSFLWALFVLVIPVIIHLFNFRRYKKIVFPNVRMLQQIDHQTKSGNRLKKYLILASRLLAFTFLVLAFAQPILLKDKQNLNSGKKHISIILDNSYSMNLTGSEGPLLEAAKNRARAIVNASGNGDEFNIVTSDMDASLLHFSNKESTLENIDKVKISNNAFPLQNLLELQNSSLMKKPGNKLAFTISDFQKKNSVIGNYPTDTSISSSWVKIDSGIRDNLSVDTCYLLSPILQTGQAIVLVCTVSNYTSKDIEGSTLELWIDGKPKGIANFNIKAYGTESRNITFTLESGGLHKCELRLPGDNIPLDDILYFSLRINNTYRVVNISRDDERYIHALFTDNPGFIYRKENSGSINFSDFKNRDLIVVQGIKDIQSGFISELKKFVQNGGTALVFPSADLSHGGLRDLAPAFGFNLGEKPASIPTKVSDLDYEHPLFKNVFENKPNKPDLPSVSQFYQYQFNGGIGLMKMSSGHSFLHDLAIGKGHLILCAVALDQAFGNFQNHALFVPVVLRSAMLSKYRNPLYYNCSDVEDIYTGLPYESESGINLQGEKTAFVPEVINKDGDLYLNTNGEISKPGIYKLKNKKSDSAIAELAFNIGRNESDTRTLSQDEYTKLCEQYRIGNLEGSAEKLASELNKVQKGIPLWKWCILFSLLFLLIEILLIRFFRNHVKLSA